MGDLPLPFAGAKVKCVGCEHLETVDMGEMATAKIKECRGHGDGCNSLGLSKSLHPDHSPVTAKTSSQGIARKVSCETEVTNMSYGRGGSQRRGRRDT